MIEEREQGEGEAREAASGEGEAREAVSGQGAMEARMEGHMRGGEGEGCVSEDGEAVVGGEGVCEERPPVLRV